MIHRGPNLLPSNRTQRIYCQHTGARHHTQRFYVWFKAISVAQELPEEVLGMYSLCCVYLLSILFTFLNLVGCFVLLSTVYFLSLSLSDIKSQTWNGLQPFILKAPKCCVTAGGGLLHWLLLCCTFILFFLILVRDSLVM